MCINMYVYRNLVIFCVENVSYVIISYSFNFVRSPYRIQNTCEIFIVENIRTFNFHTDGSVQNLIEYEIKPNYGIHINPRCHVQIFMYIHHAVKYPRDRKYCCACVYKHACQHQGLL